MKRWFYLIIIFIISIFSILLFTDNLSIDLISNKVSTNDKFNNTKVNNYKEIKGEEHTYGSINTSSYPGDIILNKTATKSNDVYGRDAKIRLSVSANGFHNPDELDFILILDRSTSMDGRAMREAKEAANKLIDNIITDSGNTKTRASIITYGNNLMDSYTTSFTTDKNKLKGVINGIPEELEGEGTNIHSALLKAEELLKTDTGAEKIVILLSDGIPTRFIGSDKSVCSDGTGDNYDYRNECRDYPSNKTTNEAESLKSQARLYTIGFGEGSSGEAFNYLKSIANANSSYSADNYLSLINTFKKIVDEFTLVAREGRVIDVIPKGFSLVKDSISNSGANYVKNNDGTTTISWNIGEVRSTITNTLYYDIVANEDFYGNMYTNNEAYFEGYPSQNNPKFNSKIKLDFPRPIVPIPMVTHNDNYINIHNHTYYTNNILSNDSKNLINNNSNITNNIIIEDIDNNFNINNNGDFKYNTNYVGCKKYNYFVESNIDGNIVRSNKSIIDLDSIDNKYIVNYLENNTGKKLLKSKVFDDNISNLGNVKIDGYRYVKRVSNNNIINIYYEAITGSVTCKYMDDLGNSLRDDVIIHGLVNSKYNTEEKNIGNYYLYKIDGNNKGKFIDGDITIKYIYKKIETIPNTNSTNNNKNYIYILFIIIPSMLYIIKRVTD